MSGARRFYLWLAAACYVLAIRVVSVKLLMLDDAPLARLHILVLGCFFLLLANHYRDEDATR